MNTLKSLVERSTTEEELRQASLEMDTLIPAGSRVQLKNLVSKPEYNGRRGKILTFDSASHRYKVRLEEGSVELLLRRPCLEVVAEAHGGSSVPMPADLQKFASAYREISAKAQSLGFDSMAHACEYNAGLFEACEMRKEVVALYEDVKKQGGSRPSSSPSTSAMVEAFDAHLRMLREVFLLTADAGRCKVVAADPSRCLSVQKVLAPLTGFDYAHMMSGAMNPSWMGQKEARAALRAFEAASPLEGLRTQEAGYTAAKAAAMAATSAADANELGRLAWVKGR